MKPTSEVKLDPGLIERISAGVRYMFTGTAPAWFGPGTIPVPVVSPELAEGAKGREFDYPVNINTRWVPRQGEANSFQILRNMADGYDLMRLVIETKKDQLSKIAWSVRPKEKFKQPDDRCKKIEDFLAMPDKEHDWHQWFRMAVEDLLVIDAWTVWPRRTLGGQPYSLELVDGATIKPVLDVHGRRPTTGPAYQQVLKGIVVADFAPGELYYMPQNPRMHKIYGYSRVEQVITTVDIALNRQMSQLGYYTEGAVPDLMVNAPEGLTMDQIKDFRSWWNDLLSGNIEERKKAFVIPHGSTVHNTKDMVLKDEMDEWLARIVCYAFSVSPQGLIKQVNRASGETLAEMAKEEGLMPILDFFQRWLTRMVCMDFFECPDLEIVPEFEQTVDPLKQAQIDDLDIKNGKRTINECREKAGLPPLENPQPQAPAAPAVAAPAGEEPPAPAQKLRKKKAKKIRPIRRDRPELLKTELRWHMGLSKALHAASKSIIPKIVKAYGELTKADETDEEIAARIAKLIEEGDLQGAADYLEVHGKDAYIAGVEVASEQMAEVTGKIMGVTADTAIEWAKKNAGERITDFANATRDDIRGILGEALEGGWSTGQLANELEDSWSFSSQRAEVIARTEVANADLAGNNALYRESGLVTKLRWLASDADACDICDELDEKEADIDGEFPGGYAADEVAHPNCRCDRVPILNDEEEE